MRGAAEDGTKQLREEWNKRENGRQTTPVFQGSLKHDRGTGQKPSLVQGRRHLRGPHPEFLRQQRGRHRRPAGADRSAPLPGRAGGDRGLAPPLLPLPPARRGVRHLRLLQHQPRLRDHERFQGISARGPSQGDARHHRAGPEPHLGPARLVPEIAPRQARLGVARFLRLERHPGPVPGCAHHLQGLRVVQLDLGPCGQGLLLAPFLFPPTRPQLRQSQGPCGHVQGHRLLARHGRGRTAA